MKKSYIAIILVVLAFFIFLAEGPFYVVDEGSQTVTTRMGRIVNTHTQAGLYMKAPFIDKITTYPARILSLEGDSERIPTKENQFIIVDTTSRWRISDPALFYQSFKTLEGAYIKLSDVIDSATR
ncbi:MAG: protease modulator HflC, partial [Treponema sp.]|nr:protease modulator HflC [Treponema sp.]